MRPTHIGYTKMRTVSFFKMKVCILFLWVALAGQSLNAQDYLLSYGPGSPSWCWQQQQQINAMAMQNMMMRQQITQYYQNQAAAVQQQIMANPFQPVQGIITYDGTYVTPETVNRYSRREVPCSHCNGGYNQKTIYLGTGGSRTIRQKCTWCHGKGTVSKLVENED